MGTIIKGLGKIGGGNGATDIGLSIMQLGMVTGLHAAISPSFFTFACFAKKPQECDIAKKTLWVSLGATTLVNLGLYLTFKRWVPALIGQLTGIGLFAGGLISIASSDVAPASPTMSPDTSSGGGSAVPANVAGVRRLRGIGRLAAPAQPDILVGQDHWIDRSWPDRYEEWWTEPGPRL